MHCLGGMEIAVRLAVLANGRSVLTHAFFA